MKIQKQRGDYNIRNKKKSLIFISILTLLIILLFVNITYAKYITIEKASSSTDIAVPFFIVEGNEKIIISDTNNIGYYEFVIKNFNETMTSETNFLYTIEIISNLDEKVQFELYNEDTQIPLENFKTPQIQIAGNEMVEQKYKLKIIYDNTKNSDGEKILEDVQIRVCSEQEKI